MANPGEEISVEVDQIGWSQDSITDTFQDGKDVRKAINALRRLSHEERVLIAATYPPISVIQLKGQGWITLDTRRLFLFRAIVNPGTQIRVRVATVQEAEELTKKLMSGKEGAAIIIRSNRRGW